MLFRAIALSRITRTIAVALIALGFAAGVAEPAHAARSNRATLYFRGP
jgi:hypothetical protein